MTGRNKTNPVIIMEFQHSTDLIKPINADNIITAVFPIKFNSNICIQIIFNTIIIVMISLHGIDITYYFYIFFRKNIQAPLILLKE